MTTTPSLVLNQVSKRFGTHAAVQDLSLQLDPEKVLALIGPSGCGKTTVLRLIAGFERPDSGSISLGERVLADSYTFVPPEERGIGMVFQDHALFPHLTVAQNVAFGLPKRARPSAEGELKSMLTLVGLDRRAQRYPHELSGGERQRVALARALMPHPYLLLLDEPFSNLDADLRVKMREEVRVILRATQATAIFVTHDQEEALYIGDHVAVMNEGRILQTGLPEEIFHRPQLRFVAEFMGNTDFLPAEVTAQGLRTEIGTLPQRLSAPLGVQVLVALRADDVQFEPQANSPSMILARRFQGMQHMYRLRLPSGRLLHAQTTHTRIYPPGTPVRVWIEPAHDLVCFLDGKAVS